MVARNPVRKCKLAIDHVQYSDHIQQSENFEYRASTEFRWLLLTLNYKFDLKLFFSRQYLSSSKMEIVNKDSVAAVAKANSDFTKKLYKELVRYPTVALTVTFIRFYHFIIPFTKSVLVLRLLFACTLNLLVKIMAYFDK